MREARTVVRSSREGVMGEADYRCIRDYLYEETGINLGPSKRSMVSARLGQRLRHHQLESFADYVQLVMHASASDERQLLVDLLSTHETRFFREDRVCCINQIAIEMPPCTPLLGHRIGLRATQLPHPIEQLAGKGSFAFLRLIAFRSQATAERPFKSGIRVLSSALIVVTRRPFPGKSTISLNL